MSNNEVKIMPLLPLRGMVVFPYMILNFDVGRDRSNEALQAAVENDNLIFLTTQMDITIDEPNIEDIHKVGTISKIKKIEKMPGGIVRVLIEGQKRAFVRETLAEKPYFKVVVEELEDINEGHKIIEEQAFMRKLQKTFEEYFNYNQHISADAFLTVMSCNTASKLADTIAAIIVFPYDVKQEILECVNIYDRIEHLIVALQNEMQILKIGNDISNKVRTQIDQNQKEYYLREQLKVIQEELGDKGGVAADAAEFKLRINKLKTSKETKEKLLKEVERFERMQGSSAESAVVRTYLESVLELPWNRKTREIIDLERAKEVLERDHYGLEKIKERILEYLAVRKLTNGGKGPILCLVGPPGVGKTSIVKSIAEAIGRKYVRISLGGVHDEADIRGHRKTYIGAMSGRVMTAMSQVKSKNPLMLFDEIDKMGSDYKGDPSAALLEVLDSEQNYSFRDHYIEVPFDLSDVLFITTANTLDTVSRPLLDRMEVIEVSGYTQEEKFNIAVKYLIPKQMKKNGIDDKKITITDDAVYDVINYYTREAGVRGLEREISSLCRKVAKIILTDNRRSVKITPKLVEKYLGKHRYNFELINEKDEVGIARGLAWTQVGGDTLSIEVNVMRGKGKVELTGKLGDIMKESAKAAISYIRSNSARLLVDSDFYKNYDIHIHVPEGAVPKDGPSAGITMATAVLSALIECPVRKDIAMTGEITIRGRVLAIGGLKEKVLAAYRAGIRTIIMPKDNRADIDEIPDEVRKEIKFIPVSHIDEVFKVAIIRNEKKTSIASQNINIEIKEDNHARTLN